MSVQALHWGPGAALQMQHWLGTLTFDDPAPRHLAPPSDLLRDKNLLFWRVVITPSP